MVWILSAAYEFKKVFSYRNLRRVYYERIKETGAIGIDRIRPVRLEARLKDELKLVVEKITAGTYKFTPYKEKLISKGQGVPPRIVSIPTARDRIVLRGLCELLSTVFSEAKLVLPQVAIDSLGEALSTGVYAEYIKIDLRNFYPSIPHEIVFKALRKKIRKAEILTLIRTALETPTVSETKGSKGSKPSLVGVPQGLAISNLLAEIALMSVDSLFEKRTDIWYKRYVDDILILVPSGFAHTVSVEIISSLKSLGLEPHPPGEVGSKSKIAPLAEPFSFLGYEITGGVISIRRESVLKFESSLASIFTAYRHRLFHAKTAVEKQAVVANCRWRLNLRITGCVFEGRRLGWVFYFSQITTTKPLRSVNRTIESLLGRFSLTGVIKPKSLIKTYYEAHRKDKDLHSYIPNFDAMPVWQQRDVLSLMLGADKIQKLSDERVEELFKMRIATMVRELEADLSGLS